MSNYDAIYQQLIKEVLTDGIWDKDQNIRPRWSDGTPAYTKSVINKQIRLDNREVPILTTKKVAWKTAIHEMLWFYVKRTSDAGYLDAHGVKIWQEWTNNHNNIGTAYGYQLGKPIYLKGEITNQVSYLLKELKENPTSRRHIISLWNIDDLNQMNLYPCVWNSQWLVKENKLHLIVQIRSNDLFLGHPFNVFQYYVLQRMIAQVTKYQLGSLSFNIADAHIYDRHIPLVEEQLVRIPFQAPTLWLNPEITTFDDFTIDDFHLEEYVCHPSISGEVAI